MSTIRRQSVNKRRSAHRFNRHEGKRHAFNLKIMRGGWRL